MATRRLMASMNTSCSRLEREQSDIGTAQVGYAVHRLWPTHMRTVCLQLIEKQLQARPYRSLKHQALTNSSMAGRACRSARSCKSQKRIKLAGTSKSRPPLTNSSMARKGMSVWPPSASVKATVVYDRSPPDSCRGREARKALHERHTSEQREGHSGAGALTARQLRWGSCAERWCE